MKIVFNSSLPRSGSTLLQNILAQNPRFYCTPTSPLYELVTYARTAFTSMPESLAQDRETMKTAFRGFCAGGLEAFFSTITDRPVCVDKGRGWLGEHEWLAQFHPNPKILVPIRDLRAILSSIEKLWHKYPHLHPAEFGKNPAPLMATIENRVDYWLSTPPVGTYSMRLLGAIEQGHAGQLHIVRFEDLTTNPQEVLNGIYDYLEEPRFTHDFTRIEQVTQEDDSRYPVYADHKIRSELKPVPPDHNEVLGEALSNSIKQNNAKFFSAFYPEQ
jgi:sulfotransferase